MFVIIDNQKQTVLDHAQTEQEIKTKLKEIISKEGDQKLADDFYRFAWEEWTDEEFASYQVNPRNMGLAGGSIITDRLPSPGGQA